MTKKVAKAMVPGSHGSTFGGNPNACAVGLEVMRQICNKKFLNNIKILSSYYHKELNLLKEEFPKIIKEIRGKGYLIGIQLFHDQTKFINQLELNNLLTIRAAENVIRILPPLNVRKQELDLSIKILRKVCLGYNNG